MVGDAVLSCYGSGDFRPARVTRTHRSDRAAKVVITTRSGRRIVSTPEHVHFAGFKLRESPQVHMTYLQWRQDMGFRVGTTRTSPRPEAARPVSGVAMRAMQERADAAWVLGTHETESEARVEEALVSLEYRLPTLLFAARPTATAGGVVAHQHLLDRVFASVDTEVHGRQLLLDQDLEFAQPHHVPRTWEGRRRNVTVTLCGDRRGRTPMHVVAVGGRDQKVKAALESIGLTVRPAKAGSAAWRYESCFKDYGEAMRIVTRIAEVVPVHVRRIARLGASRTGAGNNLPFAEARSVRAGMVMFGEDGGYDVVESVERVMDGRAVYDLDVEATHNFIAGGLVTHNSVYGFRGADITNILNFEDDYVDATVIKLEQNYRSTQMILSAANAVIANNRGQKVKHLWTDLGEGDPIKVRELGDEHGEARFVAAEIERLVDEGVSRAELAVFYRMNAQSRVLEDMLVRAQRSATRSSAAPSSTSGRRSRTRSRTSRSSSTPPTAARSPGSPTRPSGASAQTSLLARARARRDDGELRPGMSPRTRVRPHARQARGQGPRALHVDDGAAARARGGGARGRAARRDASARAAISTRWRRSGRSRRRGGSRTSRSSSASPASSTPSRPPARSGASRRSCSRSR